MMPDSQSSEAKEAMSLYAVGDVSFRGDEPESMFALTAPIIKQADIAFCQLESVLSQRGTPVPQQRVLHRAHPRSVSELKQAGFHVVSCASNHCMDWGADALLDTIDSLKTNGFLALGAGKNIVEARQPAIVERKGTRLGFLAYNSVLLPGYWAEADKPGCAPLRAYAVYEPIAAPAEPGAPCHVYTFADRQDLAAMVEDIRKLRSEVDILVLSLHWGLSFVPVTLADYQKEVGHAAIDAGADLILGHHTHVPKGIDVYKGRVIFYSLGNFAFHSGFSREYFELPRVKERHELYHLDWKYDPEYSAHYGFPAYSRKTMIVKVIISDKRIQKISFLPAYINPLAQPEVFPRTHERGQEVFRYMRGLCKGMGTKLSWEGDEVLVLDRR